jgi:hypothetical protein
MALAEDIRELQDRALADLAAAHDYYMDTKMAWKMVHKAIKAGRKITIRNKTTKNVTTEVELAQKARGYVSGQLAEATFQQFVAIFENCFFDLLRLWLLAHPQSLGAKELAFKTVLDAPDKEAVTLRVVNKELNEIAYERPKDWFKYLEARAKLGCPTQDEIGRIGEAKASRDILAHNRGIANRIYLSKAGQFARFGDGQKLDIPEHYHSQTWELIRKILTDVLGAAAVKAV